jgi:hypothetical protein
VLPAENALPELKVEVNVARVFGTLKAAGVAAA